MLNNNLDPNPVECTLESVVVQNKMKRVQTLKSPAIEKPQNAWRNEFTISKAPFLD